MARPGTATWTSILNYWLLDKDGNLDKGHTLMNPDATDPKKKLYWENKAAAEQGLKDLQLDCEFEYVVFGQFYNTVFKMKPSAQTRIKYEITEIDPDAEDKIIKEEKSESIIKNTSDNVIKENLENIIAKDIEEEVIEEENGKHGSGTLPTLGND